MHPLSWNPIRTIERKKMIPSLSLLSSSEITTIHNAALDILERVGIKIDSEEAIGVLQSAGAKVEENHIVKLSPSMIEKTIDQCSPQCTLYHRNSDKKMVLGDGVIKHSPVGWMADIVDWRTDKHRSATLGDLIESVKICDALDEISWLMSPLICSDVPAAAQELYQFKIGVTHSDKPLILSVSNIDTFNEIMALSAMLTEEGQALREKPTFAVALGLMSPLLITKDLCDVAMACARSGIPIFIYTSAMAGATSPVTLSGTLAGNHAETLAAATLIKLVDPDADIIYNSYTKPFDMMASDVSPGSPEFSLMMAAFVQLGHHINLPTGTGMFMTNSPQSDMQAGFEKMGSTFMPIMAGADFSSGMGMFAKAVVHSISALVSDAAIASYFDRMMQGFKCEKEHTAVDIYDEVKPLGNFLTTQHTMQHFKTELWHSPVIFKKSYANWIENGKKDSMENRVKKRIEKLLKQHKSPEAPKRFLDCFDNKIKSLS